MELSFKSYDELKTFICNKEKKDCVQFRIEESRTIGGSRKRLKRQIKDDLKYYEIKYRCIHSGNGKSRSTGKRPGQSTFKQNCPFIFRLRASADGQSLKAQELVDEHNHAHNKETYAFLPRQRRLDEPSKEMAKQMLKLSVDKKLLQVELLKDRKIILKDLHNLQARCVAEDSLEGTLKYLSEKQSDIEVIRDENNIFLGILYQDPEMKIMFNKFPEILFVDAIHKVSERQMSLYIFAVEDGNGESQVVAFFLAGSDDARVALKMVQLFKKHNAAWKQTQTVMTGKDFQGRRAFKNEFSHSNVIICLFQTLQTFKSEITTEKLGITIAEKCKCLKIAQKLAYSKNEQEYNSILKNIKELKIKSFSDYIKKNWHPIRHEWVISLQNAVTFNNSTNNRMKNLISKIIQVVEGNSKLPDLFKSLDIMLCSLRTEREARAMKKHLKRSVNMEMHHEDQELYLKELTSYAYELVADNFQKIEDVEVLEKAEKEDSDNPQDSFKVQSSAGVLHVTAKTCSCPFFTNMHLPCHHVLRIRQIMQMNLFETDLFLPRWTKNYFMNKVSEKTSTCVTSIPTKEIVSQHNEYSLMCQKIQQLSSLALKASSELLPQRIDVLNKIIYLWRKNIEVGDIYLKDGSFVKIEEFSSQQEKVSHHMNCLVEDESSVPTVHQDGISQQTNIPEGDSSFQIQELPPQQNEVACEITVFEDGSSVMTQDHSSEIGQVLCASQPLPILPPKVRKRKRQKGSDKAVVDLPTKKKAKAEKITPFI